MTSASPGSIANASAGNVSVTMLSHRSCRGGSGIGNAGKAGHEHDENLGDVATKQVEHELADVVEDDAAFLDRGSDCLEAIVLQDNRRRFFRDVGAPPSHRNAHVSLFQSGRVVDPVAQHCDDLATSLERGDDGQLMFGADAAERANVANACVDLRLRHRVEIATIEDVGRRQRAGPARGRQLQRSAADPR